MKYATSEAAELDSTNSIGKKLFVTLLLAFTVLMKYM